MMTLSNWICKEKNPLAVAKHWALCLIHIPYECELAFKKGTAFKGNVKLSSGMEF